MIATQQPHLYVGRERPGLAIWWLDTIGQVVDLSGYTFTVSLEQDGVETVLSGCTVTANADPTPDTGSSADVPSLSLSFAAGSIDTITAGPGLLRIVATLAGRDREWQQQIVVGS